MISWKLTATSTSVKELTVKNNYKYYLRKKDVFAFPNYVGSADFCGQNFAYVRFETFSPLLPSLITQYIPDIKINYTSLKEKCFVHNDDYPQVFHCLVDNCVSLHRHVVVVYQLQAQQWGASKRSTA
jgi:hypothetical protein